MKACHLSSVWKMLQKEFFIPSPRSTVVLGTFLTDFRCILHSVRLQKWKVHLLSFKTSPYRKILAKNYL